MTNHDREESDRDGNLGISYSDRNLSHILEILDGSLDYQIHFINYGVDDQRKALTKKDREHFDDVYQAI